MNTLFGKIFLWFFGAQVLIGLALFGLGFSQREAATPQPVQQMLGDELRWQTQIAALLAQTGQLDQFVAQLADTTAHARSSVFWRPNGETLRALGPLAVSPAQRQLAQMALSNSGLQWQQSDDLWGGALATSTPTGTLVVVRQVPRRPISVFGFLEDWRTSQGRTRFVVFLLVTALVCYGLARYITAPVARLRVATHRLAEGDLGARVGFSARGGDELIVLGRDFDRMASRLEAGLEAERRLLGDISHELRSPLARLSVALDLVEQNRARAAREMRAVPEQIYENALERIRRESGRLNEMIGQLLELSRLELLAREGEARTEIVNLGKIVADVVADARYEAQNGRTIELRAGDKCELRGDAKLLHSAIENVVRNAIRYTAENTAVQVELRRENHEIALSVRDHGAGVPEAALENLFRPFYRVNTGRDRQSGGVGLGLAIAERALKVHDASIRAFNAEGGGLEVEMRFPLAQSNL